MRCLLLFAVTCALILCAAVNGQDDVTNTTTSTTTAAAEVEDSVTPASPLLNQFKIYVAASMQDKTAYEGERVNLECEITGHPTPQYTWYKDGNRIIPDDSRHYSIRTLGYANKLRITDTVLSDTGTYKCVGSNLNGTREVSASLTILSAPRTTTIAPRIISPSVKSDGEETIQPFCQDFKGTYCNFLKTEEIYVTSRADQNNAERYILDLVTQLGDINLGGDNECFQKSVEATCYERLPICRRREAQLPVPRRLCRQECEALFQICKKDFEDDASRWSLLPSCAGLDNSAGCIHIGLTTTPKMQVNPGDVIKNKSDDNMIPDILLSVVLPIVLAVLLLLAITVVVLVCICKRRKKSSTGRNSIPSTNGSQAKSVELSSISEKAAVFIKEVSLDNINMLQELGLGAYCKVYHGQVFGLYGNNTASAVFIKCLEEKATAEQVAEFRDEASSLSEIRHQHIVSLLGVSTKGMTQCLLYEFLQLGDLRQFLLSQQSHGNMLSCKELMYMVTQVASGLEYLSTQHYIHKDVAAHNVIVSHNLNVKLSNLKITQGVHSANYCTIHNKLMPIRWLPPESITYNKFTLDTDIFSYGVLLWEAFSGAQLPYNGFSNQEVIDMVRSRQLLACPNACPPRIYSLMMECWHETPDKRPTAKELHQKLRAWYLDNSYALSTTGTGQSASGGSTCTAPSHHSSQGPVPHPNVTESGSEPAIRPGYLQPNGEPGAVPYYSTIDSYKHNLDSPTSCSSYDQTESEYTDGGVGPPVPLVNNLPPNYYSSTPQQRYASLSRRRPDADFGTQTTPLFQQTDQV